MSAYDADFCARCAASQDKIDKLEKSLRGHEAMYAMVRAENETLKKQIKAFTVVVHAQTSPTTFSPEDNVVPIKENK